MEPYLEKRIQRGNLLYPFEVRTQTNMGRGLMARAHYHDCIEILYGQAGCFEALLGGHRHAFAAGDMILIHAQEPHMVTSESDSENSYVVLKFYPELLFSSEQSVQEMRYLDAFSAGSRARRQVFSRGELEASGIPALVEELLDEWRRQAFGFEIAVRIALCRLFLWVIRHWNGQGIRVLESARENAEALQKLQEIAAYIDSSYGDRITLQSAARRCGMGYSAFSKFFTRHMGKSFVEYLTQVRISKAKLLLATTDMSITETALEAGFSTTSYFIARFRGMNHITPGQYRAQFQRQDGGGEAG